MISVKSVYIAYNETIALVLPDGTRLDVLLSYEEPGKQFPELDLKLPQDSAINCFGENLMPAIATTETVLPVNLRKHEEGSHIRTGRQVIIPLEFLGKPV